MWWDRWGEEEDRVMKMRIGSDVVGTGPGDIEWDVDMNGSFEIGRAETEWM